jgi:hypothetical protein
MSKRDSGFMMILRSLWMNSAWSHESLFSCRKHPRCIGGAVHDLSVARRSLGEAKLLECATPNWKRGAGMLPELAGRDACATCVE